MDVTTNYNATGKPPTRERSVLGMSPREMRVLLAVMSHTRVYGQGPTNAEVERFLSMPARAATLVRFGWLTVEGTRYMRLSATNKCWRVFGFARDAD